jgi:hypothetical protein
MSLSWNEEYYHILSFYFWEPQHLGKIKNPASNYENVEQVLAHIERMEVSLNHHLNLFLSLMPDDFIAGLFSHSFGEAFTESGSLVGRTEQEGDLFKATQPDIYFKGEEILVGVELKVAAKSSLDQVFKYALLYTLEDEAEGLERAHYLLYLAPGEFSTLWGEPIDSVTALKAHLADYALPAETSKRHIPLEAHHAKIRQNIAQMKIAHLTYQQLFDFLGVRIQAIKSERGPDSSELKLLKGMQAELLRRGNVKVKAG